MAKHSVLLEVDFGMSCCLLGWPGEEGCHLDLFWPDGRCDSIFVVVQTETGEVASQFSVVASAILLDEKSWFSCSAPSGAE